MKTYSAASDDLTGHISRMQSQFHPEIEGVTVGALFVFDEESEPGVGMHCAWMPFQKGQAVRTEQLERAATDTNAR